MTRLSAGDLLSWSSIVRDTRNQAAEVTLNGERQAERMMVKSVAPNKSHRTRMKLLPGVWILPHRLPKNARTGS